MTRYLGQVNLRRLRYFLVVAEELNYSRAARRLSIAGPSLSQQIKTLEGELKVQLFERDRRSVQLTQAGAALVADARALVAQADELVRRAGQSTSQKQVRLGLASQVPASMVERVSLMGTVNIDNWAVPSHLHTRRVSNGNLDMAICHADANSLAGADLEGHLVGAEPLHAIYAGSDSVLARAEQTAVLVEAEWLWWSWNHYAREFALATGAVAINIDDGGLTSPAFYEHVRRLRRPVVRAPVGPTDPLARDMTKRGITDPAPLWTWSLVHRRDDHRSSVREVVEALTKDLAWTVTELKAFWLPRDDPHRPTGAW